jgi:hypothetical protein
MSLETDDLMVVFRSKGMQNLMLHLGMEENVPIESKMITKRIQAIQRTFTLNESLSRHVFTIMEEAIRITRESLFHSRENWALAYSFQGDITQLLDDYVRRLIRSANVDSMRMAALEAAAQPLGIVLPADLYVLGDSPPQLLSKFRALLSEEYARRRLLAGEYAAARERAIFLRSVDLCWARFIYTLSQRTDDSAIASEGRRSSFSKLAELLPLLHSERQRLREQTDALIVSHLFQIHQLERFQSLLDWCGWFSDEPIGLPSLDWWDASEGSKWVVYPQANRLLASLREYLDAYSDELRTLDSAAVRHWDIQEVPDRYGSFLDRRKFVVENARESVEAYLRQGRSLLKRTFRRNFDQDVLFGFLEHLVHQGILSSQDSDSLKQATFRQKWEALGKLAQPVVAAELMYLALFIVVYRYLNSAALPFSTPHLGQRALTLATQVPRLVRQFIDDALVGGSWTVLSLGIVGMLPMIATDFAFRTLKRQWYRTGMIVSLPAALLFCLLAASSLVNWDAGFMAGSLSLATVFTPLFLATVLIMFLVDTANIVELLDGVSLALFINLTGWIVRSILQVRHEPVLRWWAIAFAAAVGFLFWLARRISIASVAVARTGRLGFEQSGIEAHPTKLHVDTIFDHNHYLIAFIVGAYTSWGLGRWLPAAWFNAILWLLPPIRSRCWQR